MAHVEPNPELDAYCADLVKDWPAPTPEQADLIRSVIGGHRKKVAAQAALKAAGEKNTAA